MEEPQVIKRALTVLVAFAAVTATASAQRRQSSADDADTKEIAAYKLTEPVLQKVVVATKTMADAIQQDPKYRTYMAAEKELAALQKKEEQTAADEARIEALEKQIEAFKQSEEKGAGNDTQSLADMERKIAAIPHMSESLTKAGLSAHEFAVFEMCALQAGMVAGLEKSGQKLNALPSGIQPANVQFMKDHEQDFKALTESMKAK